MTTDTKETVKYIYESPDGGKTVYRRKFGQNPRERELVDLRTVVNADGYSHSKYYYEYDRNDSSRPNPFETKKSWILPVEQFAGADEYLISFPKDLLEASNLKEGDLIEWIDQGDGSYLLKKVVHVDHHPV
jgi:hypothetical protein